MTEVVGIRFRDGGKVYYFDPSGVKIQDSARVLVETVRGLELGTVVMAPKKVAQDRLVLPLRKVLRVATQQDEEVYNTNKEKAEKAMETARKKIEEHDLEMRLVDAEYTFEGSRVVLYFTADGRVDFRQLVKDLASCLKVRVELRQIGVRDQAKMTGGIGPCGRPICCTTFLNDFQPVSIKMAKDQNLSLNPSKISGSCGRLLCCLRFECEHYEDSRNALPDVGTWVVTPEGEGRVSKVNALKAWVSVELEDGQRKEFPAEEVDEKRKDTPSKNNERA